MAKRRESHERTILYPAAVQLEPGAAGADARRHTTGHQPMGKPQGTIARSALAAIERFLRTGAGTVRRDQRDAAGRTAPPGLFSVSGRRRPRLLSVPGKPGTAHQISAERKGRYASNPGRADDFGQAGTGRNAGHHLPIRISERPFQMDCGGFYCSHEPDA